MFSSCKNDDSSSIENLIGQWKIVQRTLNGIDYPLGECEPFNIYTYNEDGTYSELIYTAVANSECLDNPNVEFTGTWEKGDTLYIFNNSNSETSEVIIEFTSNNSFTKTNSGLTFQNEPVISTLIEKFERIQ